MDSLITAVARHARAAMGYTPPAPYASLRWGRDPSKLMRSVLAHISGTVRRARQHLGLQPVADFEEAQRLGAHGWTQSVLPEKRRIGWVFLQGAKFGGERGERCRVAEHPFLHQRVTVALGRRGNVEIVVLRVVLHPPESAASVGE